MTTTAPNKGYNPLSDRLSPLGDITTFLLCRFNYSMKLGEIGKGKPAKQHSNKGQECKCVSAEKKMSTSRWDEERVSSTQQILNAITTENGTKHSH